MTYREALKVKLAFGDARSLEAVDLIATVKRVMELQDRLGYVMRCPMDDCDDGEVMCSMDCAHPCGYCRGGGVIGRDNARAMDFVESLALATAAEEIEKLDGLIAERGADAWMRA